MPVLLALTVVKAHAAVPDLDSTQHYISTNARLAQGEFALTYTVQAVFSDYLSGTLEYGQKVKITNNLKVGGVTAGAHIINANVTKVFDFKGKPPGTYLMDGKLGDFPMYILNRHESPGRLVKTVTNSDSPVLPVEPVELVGDSTDIDVTYQFISYAIWRFSDESIYFLAESDPWTVRYQGTISPKAGGGFQFAPGHDNAIVGTKTFTLNNTTPNETAPPPAVANLGGGDWQ